MQFYSFEMLSLGPDFLLWTPKSVKTQAEYSQEGESHPLAYGRDLGILEGNKKACFHHYGSATEGLVLPRTRSLTENSRQTTEEFLSHRLSVSAQTLQQTHFSHKKPLLLLK